MSTKMWSILLTLPFTYLAFLSVVVSLDFLCTDHAFFPDPLSNHCQCLICTFSKICTTFDAVPLWDSSRNCATTPNKRTHKLAVHPAAWNFVHWLPRYANSIIYRCISLQQRLYSWRHQSRKLWISSRCPWESKHAFKQTEVYVVTDVLSISGLMEPTSAWICCRVPIRSPCVISNNPRQRNPWDSSPVI
jgi:hypothetical protein